MKRRLAIVEIFRHREPALLVSGQTVSNFGDGVATVALSLLVIDTTHSVSKLAWFAAARMIPLVALLLIGGAIVDRVSRRVLLIVSDVGRGVLTGLLAAAIVAHVLTFTEMLVFAVAFGAFDALFAPAISAITPDIVPEDLLPAMNAVRPLSSNLVGNMIGPAVGGILAAWSTSAAIGLDCLTFVVSAASLALMRPTPKPVRESTASMLADIREGLGYVRRTTWIWTTLAAVTLVNALVLTPMFVLVPYFLRHNLHVSKPLFGYAFVVMGATGALGAVVAGNLKMPRRRIRVIWTYWTISCAAAFIFAAATNYWEVLIFPIVASPCITLGNVIWETMMQAEVPRELLGRVSSVDWFVSLGLSPIGLVVAGSLSSAIGIHTYFVVMASVCIVPGLAILASKSANAVDRDRVSPGAGEGPSTGAPAPIESPS
ncbi:MAG: MFS transporter [Acidimicrobiales bacterium]